MGEGEAVSTARPRRESLIAPVEGSHIHRYMVDGGVLASMPLPDEKRMTASDEQMEPRYRYTVTEKKKTGGIFGRFRRDIDVTKVYHLNPSNPSHSGSIEDGIFTVTMTHDATLSGQQNTPRDVVDRLNAEATWIRACKIVSGDGGRIALDVDSLVPNNPAARVGDQRAEIIGSW